MIQLKSYQQDDLARLCLLDGAILGWTCGLGKTPAMFIWALMKCGWTEGRNVKAPVLIISPEDLHGQTIAEGQKFFGIEAQTARHLDFSKPIPPGFYLASYGMLEQIPADAFECVILDEGDKAKKTGSDAGRLVRRLKPRYRLICTATPMADRLPDLFWLCSWVCENDKVRRWPYAPTAAEFARFSSRFQVDGRNLGRSRSSGEPSIERTAEVSQLLMLWKLLSSIVLRRRMEDTGERIVGLDHKVVSCPLSRDQHREYAAALFDAQMDIGVKLGALRRIAGGAVWPNPKLSTALELVANIIGRGEQVLIASDFRGPNDSIRERLRDACIPHVLMDGRTNPRSRGRLADEFRTGKIPVGLIGLKSGAEGQSYPACNNVILLNYSWEYKKLPQVIHRARRINSLRDLNVWSLVAEGTIENRMARLVVDEKGVAADLVLDGVWPGATAKESDNWIAVAANEFKSDQRTVDERELAGQWPMLRERLRSTLSANAERSYARRSGGRFSKSVAA